MATTKTKKRILFVWGTATRGNISVRPKKQPRNALSNSIYKNRESAARMARRRRQFPEQGIEYEIRYEKPSNIKGKK